MKRDLPENPRKEKGRPEDGPQNQPDREQLANDSAAMQTNPGTIVAQKKSAPKRAITAKPLPIDQLHEFLKSIFRDDWPKAYITGFSEPPDSFDSSTEPGRVAAQRAWAGAEFKKGRKLVNPDRNCYLCISTFREAPHERARRRKELLANVHAIMIDDVGQKVDPSLIPIEPTFIVRTSETSSQYWYVLSTPCSNADQVNALLDGLVDKGLAQAADPGMKGVTRYGRLPFGINNKKSYGKPWKVALLGDWREGPRYSVEEIAAAFKVDISSITKTKRETLAPDGITELEEAHLKALDAENFKPRGPYGDSRRYALATCPWSSEHTTGKGDAHYFPPSEENAWNGGFKCFHGHCVDKKGIRDLVEFLRAKGHNIPDPSRGFGLDDFLYIAPQNAYLCTRTGDLWREEALDKTFDWPKGKRKKKDKKTGQEIEEEVAERPSRYIAWRKRVTQMTWMPGHQKLIDNAVLDENGFFDSIGGARIANLYTAPRTYPGDPAKAQPWLDHIQKLYPAHAGDLTAWFAHRVQRPAEKINYCVVMCGPPGIGKDSVIDPVIWAAGVGNTKEIGPTDLWSDFNDHLQAVILRVSESHDLGEHSRHAFYERTKRILAAPPHVFDINGKYMKKYRIRNVVGVIFTSNHEGGGLYIPDDDRRYFVLWTEVTQADFPPDYFRNLWLWYRDEGFRHVAAYLRAYDLTGFNPKGNPPKTESFLRVALSNQRSENAAFRQVLERLGNPPVVTFDALIAEGRRPPVVMDEDFLKPILGKGRVINEIMRSIGYSAVLRHPPTAGDGGGKREQRWRVGGKLQTVYGRIEIGDAELRAAAASIAREEEEARK